jgi:hypothetical protein
MISDSTHGDSPDGEPDRDLARADHMLTQPIPVPLPPKRQPAPRGNVHLLVPFGVGALVSVVLGVYGRVHTPTGLAVTGPFPSMIAMKVALTTVALGLALVQLASALWMYGKLGRPAPRWVAAFHRGTGSLAFIVTLPVAFHCLWSVGFATVGPRAILHSLLGCLFYGAFVTKVLSLTSRRVPGWVIPWIGGVLFTALVTAALTSAGWYLTR